jgi:multiple sugar transport system substrate-binding protein
MLHRTLNRRTFVGASAAGALGLALSPRFGAFAQGTPAANTALSGTVTFWATYNTVSPEYDVLTTEVIPAFNALYPNIKIKAQAIPDSDMRQKLLAAVAGGEAPDIARMDIVQVPEFAELGGLAAVDELISDFATYSEQFYPGTLATNMFQGHYYGLPLDTNTRLLFFNPDLLEEAGVTAPPATFDDFQAAAEKVKALGKSGVTGFSEGGTGAWNVLPWIWSNGGAITDDKYTVATGYLNSEGSVGAVTLLKQWLDDGLISPTIRDGGVATSEELAKGNVAMIVDGPWMPAIFAAQYPDFKFDLSAFPKGPGGSVSVVGGEDIVLFDSSKSKDAALAFMQFITSQPAQLDFAPTGQMSVLKDLGNSPDVPAYFPVFQTQLQTAQPRTPSPAWPKIDEAIGNAVTQVITGEAEAQSALDDAAAAVDELLAKYKQ